MYQHVTDLIGSTPLVALDAFTKLYRLNGRLLGKLEYFNPLGSVKDRVAYGMIKEGIDSGVIQKDTVLIEPTSGNTGIGLAFVAAQMGLKLILVMPDTMSVERQRIVRALGALVVLSPGIEGMKGSIRVAEELQQIHGNAFILQQFTNPANPNTHYETTGPEIWKDTNGEVDVFISSIGTGGTVTGVGRYLKEQNPAVQIIGVEPTTSAVLSGKEAGPHGIQGIGAGFIPDVLDTRLLDKIVTVSTEDAYKCTRTIAKTEGLLLGISSGSALQAAIQIGQDPAYKDKNIVVLLPDGGERYLSTGIFDA